MRTWLEHRRIDGQVRVLPGKSTWIGAQQLVSTYGYGPLVPNTVVAGAGHGVEFAEMVAKLLAGEKNAVVLRSEEGELWTPSVVDSRYCEAFDEAGDAQVPYIDVWWRGKGQNAAFMLALACMLQRSSPRHGARIRLCHLLAPDEAEAAETKRLEEFLSGARVRGEACVVAPEPDRTAFQNMAAKSHEAAVVLMGLRPPAAGETAEAWAQYFDVVCEGTKTLPQAVFACAAEGLDFSHMF